MIKKESILLKLYQYDLSEFDAQQIIGLSNAIKDNNPALLTAMRAKKNTAIDANITPRTINYWSEIGLFDKNNQIADNKWHKFSFVDIAFILIVAKLRDFGMNLEKIKTTKKDLFKLVAITDENGNTIFNSQLSLLETAILLAFTLHNHGNIYLIVDNSGHTTYFMDESFVLNRDKGLLPTAYIHLNLNELLNKNPIITGVLAEIQHEPIKQALNANEKQILDTLKQPSLEQMTVIKDIHNGKLSRMTETHDTTTTFNAQVIQAIQNICEHLGVNFGGMQFTIRDGKFIKGTDTKTTLFK